MNVIIFKEKHYDRVFVAENNDDIDNIFLKVFNDRLEQNWYNLITETNDTDLRRYYKIAQDKAHSHQAKAARLLMSELACNEYEGFEIIEPESFE